MILDESNIKAKVGTVSRKSALSDPHIQKLLKYVAKEKGVPEKEIEAHLNSKLAEMQDLEKKAPTLYHSMVQNAIEAAIFNMFDETVEHLHPPEHLLKKKLGKVKSPADLEELLKGDGKKKLKQEKTAVEFDPITFAKLVRRIKVENPSFFPLRNFFNKKPITSPRIVLVPSKDKEDAKFNDIDTAAATPRGEFIFSIPFMQQCMNYSHVAGIKPKGKKYQSNGGEFPDEWAMIEFLIMHEFFHYTHADFHYQKVLKANPTIINWVGDFRSNYDLIKMGMEPIPIGLYNDLINYDRQGTYREMYEIVKKEFEKLNKNDQNRVQQGMEGMAGDSHDEHHGDEEPGEGGTTGSGRSGSGKPDPNGKPGSGGDEATEGDLEEHGKRVSDRAGTRNEGAQAGEGDKAGAGKPGGNPGGKGGRGGGAANPYAIDWANVRPRYSWKQLIARLVKGADETEVTYQKVHRRNITGVHVAAQMGAGVIRPGEKVVPAHLVKLCIVIDSSGSMASSIATVMANINKLLSESGISKTFAIVEFSTNYHMYAATISGHGRGSAREIKSPREVAQGSSSGSVDLSTILTRHQSGSTNFSPDLVADLKQFMDMKYNVLIMTDTDIAAGGNWDDFMSLFKHNREQCYLILDNQHSFATVAQKMKGASGNISHL